MSKNEDEEREDRIREVIADQADRSIALRSKDREFHGLEREFRYLQAQMLTDYSRSKDLKHPRDLGTVREQILRKFLTESGYLPKRYTVSEGSARVVSGSGHISNELDIVLYDTLDSVTLMRREDVYEAFPIESVHGVIQVKSRLNRNEIRDGLANLASFKKLDRQPQYRTAFKALGAAPTSDRGFGLLFAYDSDLEWRDIIAGIEDFAAEHPKRLWANAIVVLSKGLALFGEDLRATIHNEEIEAIQSLRMHARPDREGNGLFHFQSILLSLLRRTEVHPVDIDRYFRLPLIADSDSYSFVYGMISEIGNCQHHGDFARKIAPEQLKKLVAWCRGIQPMNWIRAIDIAYGRPEDEEAYRRQPGDIYVYNPEDLAFRDILTREAEIGGIATAALSFDAIETSGMTICVPYYYSVKEGIVSGCPKCRDHAQ